MADPSSGENGAAGQRLCCPRRGSSAICHYIEAKHPDPALICAEARARGQVIWFDEFADTILFGCGQKVFFNRVVAPRFLNRPRGDESVAEAALRHALHPILEYLETVVPGEGGFLLGESRVTFADISVASPFANFRHLGIELNAGKYSGTRRYVKSILEHPSFKPFVAKEAAFLERAAA